MASVTVLTATRMLAIEAAAVISGIVDTNQHLILQHHDGSTTDAGYVAGSPGAPGDPGSPGAPGDPGNDGLDGLSIVSALVDGSNHLILTMSDTTTVDAGVVVGPKGDKGDTGAASTVAGPSGRGVSSATVNGSNHLILTMSDATTIDAGVVVGPQGNAGVGISSATVNGSGHLILTKTDSSTVDAGLVAGTNGTNGVGISSATVNGSGHLILTKTDASTVDAGLVAGTNGTNGTNGSPGAAGLGVASAAINGSNHLILTRTDATTLDAGVLPANTDVPGIVKMNAGYTAPAGYLPCMGGSYPISTYPALDGALNTTAGAFSVAASTSGTFTASAAHGLNIGDSVAFTAASVAMGFTPGKAYLVVQVPTSTTFLLNDPQTNQGVSVGNIPTANSTLTGWWKSRWGFTVVSGARSAFFVPNMSNRSPVGTNSGLLPSSAPGVYVGSSTHAHTLGAAWAQFSYTTNELDLNRIPLPGGGTWTDVIKATGVTTAGQSVTHSTGVPLGGSTDTADSRPPLTYIDFIIKT